jgi:hypothetical protein
MKVVQFTDAEAHLISEVFEATAYPGLQQEAIRETGLMCGTLEKMNDDDFDDLLASIFNKTK